jgi:hypothetical protein
MQPEPTRGTRAVAASNGPAWKLFPLSEVGKRPRRQNCRKERGCRDTSTPTMSRLFVLCPPAELQRQARRAIQV